MASSRKSPKNSTLLARVIAVIKRHVQGGDRLVVGLSGGIDSVVLLDLLHRAARRCRFELAAVHVNHQINPAADAWAKFCRALCRGYGVPLTVKKVAVKRGNSLEASARAARYAVYAAMPGAAIVLAHNQDDQVETLLLQLLRGTGVKGASAMPEYRIQDRGLRIERSGAKTGLNLQSSILNPAFLRPLLDAPRSEIAGYARARKLQWIEDDSNTDTAFDRNYIRHRVLPVIAERYAAYRQTLARASRNFAETAELIDACAAADAGNMTGDAAGALDVARLLGLSALRIKNVLRYFLACNGVQMPNARRLEECARQLSQATAGSRMTVRLGGYDLRRFGDQLQLVPASAKAATPISTVQWQGEKRLALPQFAGVLAMTPRHGKGISLAKIARKKVTLRGREGGERLRLDAARPSRTLKNLWQELRIPEWQRGKLPLLFVGNALAYVAGVGVDAAFCAAAGEAGVEPEWRADSP